MKAIADKKAATRTNRACDLCRKKKIRCDGAEQPDGLCTQCADSKTQCSYIESSKRRAAPKWYVERLEARLDKVEALLEKLHPGVSFPELGEPVERGCWLNTKSEPEDNGRGVFAPPILPSSFGTSPPPLEPADQSLSVRAQPQDTYGLENLRLDAKRYYGQTSSASFIIAAVQEKPEYRGAPRSEWGRLISRNCRKAFWMTPPWETQPMHNAYRLELPPTDLLHSLIDLYFSHSNPILPILHRPTFEALLREKIYERNHWFGCVVLFVCAVASRYSDDPRVREGDSQHSAGWTFFKEVHKAPRHLVEPVTLFHMQAICLIALFMLGSSSPQNSWGIVGIGLRFGQDVGAHLRKTFASSPPAERELWSRAFWSLVVLDRILSGELGRNCAIQTQEIDLDPVTEVDDEYWPTTNEDRRGFSQPPGVPSKLQFFNCLERMTRIYATAQKAIFIDHLEPFTGTDRPEWQQDLLVQMDSALNGWKDEIPDHLKWDPDRVDRIFFIQSALLHALHYQFSILVHRAFIPFASASNKIAPGLTKITSPSLDICTNAARVSSRIVDAVCRRENDVGGPWLLTPPFVAGIVLQLNIWGQRKTNSSNMAAYTAHLEDVHRCMNVLSIYERRWLAAGKLNDILTELASVGDIPIPPVRSPGGLKRSRAALAEDDDYANGYRDGDQEHSRHAKMYRPSPTLSWSTPSASTPGSTSDQSSNPPAGWGHSTEAGVQLEGLQLGGDNTVGTPTQQPTLVAGSPPVQRSVLSTWLPFASDSNANANFPTPPSGISPMFGTSLSTAITPVASTSSFFHSQNSLDQMVDHINLQNPGVTSVEWEIWEHFMGSPSIWDMTNGDQPQPPPGTM